MLIAGKRRAEAMSACFILAGFTRCSGTPLARRATAPATTGDATLVPEVIIPENISRHQNIVTIFNIFVIELLYLPIKY